MGGGCFITVGYDTPPVRPAPTPAHAGGPALAATGSEVAGPLSLSLGLMVLGARISLLRRSRSRVRALHDHR